MIGRCMKHGYYELDCSDCIRDQAEAENAAWRTCVTHHACDCIQTELAAARRELAAAKQVVEAARDIAYGFDETCGKFPEIERAIAAYDAVVKGARHETT